MLFNVFRFVDRSPKPIPSLHLAILSEEPLLPAGPKTGSKWTSEDLHRAVDLVRRGVPIKPAAEQCRIPVMTLWRRTRALGVKSSRAMTCERQVDHGFKTEVP